MLLGPCPEAVRPPPPPAPPRGWPWTPVASAGQSVHQEGALCSPPPRGQSVRVRKGRGRNASVLGGSWSTNPAHPVFFGKYTDAGTQAPPAPQGPGAPPPHLLLPGPPPTKKAEEDWAGGSGLGRWVRGSAVWRARAGNTKLKSSSRHSVRVGAGVLPASRLRRRTFYQSGGCAGRGSWRRPCPESERQGGEGLGRKPVAWALPRGTWDEWGQPLVGLKVAGRRSHTPRSSAPQSHWYRIPHISEAQKSAYFRGLW